VARTRYPEDNSTEEIARLAEELGTRWSLRAARPSELPFSRHLSEAVVFYRVRCVVIVARGPEG
jgi:hypothetical protein